MVNAVVENVERRRSKSETVVAVAVDQCSRSIRDALRWAIDHVVAQGQSVILVHVTASSSLPPYGNNELEIRPEPDEQAMYVHVLTSYICFCLMRKVECEPVVLQNSDVAQALSEFVAFYGVETFILGGATRNWVTRGADILTKLEKSIPSFCNMYGIHNGTPSFAFHPFHHSIHPEVAEETFSSEHVTPDHEWSLQTSAPASPSVSAPISRISSTTQADEFSFQEVDFSFIRSERPSTDSSFISLYKSLGNRDLSTNP